MTNDSLVHGDFKRLLELLDRLIHHPSDEPAIQLNVNARGLAEKCLGHIAAIRGGLDAREKLNAQWEGRLEAASSALSDLLASLSRVGRNGLRAPEMDCDPEGARQFDTARSTLTRFNDALLGLPAEWLLPALPAARQIEGVAASSRAAIPPSPSSLTDKMKGGRKRAGRLPKDESDAKRNQMMATLRQHPSMKDDPSKLAIQVGVSEATVRRWLEDEETKYRESAVAKGDPGE